MRWSDGVGPLLGRPRGWTPASFAEFLELVHDDDRAALLARLDGAMRTGAPYDPVYRVRWPDGSWHWVRGGTAWVERDADGTVRRMDGATWDVTALEESVAARRASEARLALVLDSTSELMFLIGVERPTPDGPVTFRCESVNAAYRAVTGLADADLIGRTLEEVLAPAEAAFSRGHYEAALRTGAVQRYDEVVDLPTGRLVVETALTPMPDATGRITHLLGTARDVTALRRAEMALRESEARYRRLVDASPDGVFVHVGPAIRYVNAAGARLVGVDDVDALAGRTLLEFVAPEERDALVARLQRAAATGEFGTAEQTLVRQDTGARVVVEVSAVPVRFVEAGHEVDAVQATLRDITQRRQAEAERQALEARLQYLQKLEAVGQLAGGLAHDLNNLLLVVSGNRELAEAELGPGHAARPMLGEMAAAVDRAGRLVRSLLTFSRRETIQPESLDAAEVLRGFAPLLRTAIGEKVVLRIEALPGPLRLVADRSHLEQVLMNLVVNARDAVLTPRHGRGGTGGIVTVTLRRRARADDARAAGATRGPGGSILELVVRDDGHGMDDEALAHAFEPFFTTKPVGAGTGLGLATVFGIVQRMRGDVRIASRVGEGTTVTVRLPLDGDATVDAPTAPPAPTAPAGPPVGVPTSSTMGLVDAARATDGGAPATTVAGTTVLLVEDEPSVRRVARRLLERAGARVLDAANGADALGVWRAHRDAIRLVVTDVRMPVMDGLELAHRLRADRADLPLVFMSGYADRAPLQEWAEGLAFVPKPFGARDLLAALQAVLTSVTDGAGTGGVAHV